MRWKRKTLTEKRCDHARRVEAKANAYKARADAQTARAKTWTRSFAWYPHHDATSGMVYFLEYVWSRASAENQYSKHFRIRADQAPITIQVRYPRHWEYRGGKDAPEIKTAPAMPEGTPTLKPAWLYSTGTVTCTKCGHTYRQRSLAEDQT